MTSSSVNTPTKTTGKLDKSSKTTGTSSLGQVSTSDTAVRPGTYDPRFRSDTGTYYSGALAGAMQKHLKKDNLKERKAKLAEADIRESIAADTATGKFTGGTQTAPTVTRSMIADKVASMDAERNYLGKGKKTPAELNRLANLNRELGINETTGMGLLNSLKYNVTNPEFKRDIKQAGQLLGSLPTPMNILRRIGTGLLTDFGGIKDAVTGAQKSQRQPGLFASEKDSKGLFGGMGEGIGNLFSGLRIGPSDAGSQRRGGERRALNLRDGIYGGVDPLSSSAVARDVSPLSTPATNVVNPTTGAIDYSSAMATSPVLSNQMLASPATLPTMAAQGTPYRLRNYYAGVLGQDPAMYAANGGRVGKMHGGMMIMGDDGVVNNGIGGILSKYKEIRSEL